MPILVELEKNLQLLKINYRKMKERVGMSTCSPCEWKLADIVEC